MLVFQIESYVRRSAKCRWMHGLLFQLYLLRSDFSAGSGMNINKESSEEWRKKWVLWKF